MNLLSSSRVLLVLGALAAGLALAACGSSGKTSTTTAAASSTSSSNFAARRTALAACLRQHGVTLPNRPPRTRTTPPPGGFVPGGGGGGGFFRGAASNPKLRAAFQACGGNFRAGRRPGAFRFSQTRIDNYVACVRKHGYPQMPNPNFSGKAPVFPNNIRSNVKFQSASRACQSVLIPRGALGAPGGQSTT